MKIKKIEATVVKMPWVQQFRGGVSESKGAAARIDFLESVIVKLFAEDGTFGIGEGTLSYGGSKGRANAGGSPLVLGENLFDVEKIMNQLDFGDDAGKAESAQGGDRFGLARFDW